MADPKVLISELTADPAPVLADLMFPATRSGTTWKLTGTQLSTLLSTAFSLGTMATQNANAVNVTGGTLAGVNVKSNSFVVDNTDATKKLAQDISSFSTGVTRTVIWPDSNGTVTLIDLAQRLRNKSLEDVSTAFVATADNTKKVRMDVSAISPSTTRIVAWPDANVTISAYAATLLDDADAATARTTLNVQTLNSKLTAISGLTVANGKFIRWTSATTCVAQDMVGTVSQSSGVPTGAIIERGSNANGEYVRYADGTQICTYRDATGLDLNTASGSIYRSTSDGTWTFPIAFAAGTYPVVSCSPESPSRFAATNGGSNTSATYRYFGPVNNVSVLPCTLMAVGRWF